MLEALEDSFERSAIMRMREPESLDELLVKLYKMCFSASVNNGERRRKWREGIAELL